MRFRRNVFAVLLMGCLALLAACGGGAPNITKPAAPVVVAVSAASPTVMMPGSVQMTATVTNTSNTGVTWAISPTTGTISASGLFTPAHAGTYTITATSAADTSRYATAKVVASAPAPAITSTPGTTVGQEGTYTYTVTGTDPIEGGDVTFELTTAPEGATFEDNTVTWTATVADRRKAIPFAITASTPEGGSLVHSWTVSPAGIITLSFINKYTYWNLDPESENLVLTTTDVPVDMSTPNWDIEVGAPLPDGSAEWLYGTGSSDGTFTIENVPGGKYWLYVSDGNSQEYYWTDSSEFDYGQDYIGRPYQGSLTPVLSPNVAISDTINTTFAFELAGFSQPEDRSCCWSFEMISPNAGFDYYSQYGVGSTVYENTEGPYSVRPIDPVQGDSTYVLQWDRVDRVSGMADKTNVRAVTSALASNDIATVPEGTTTVAGTMAAAPKAFDVNVKGSAWAEMSATAGPGMTQVGDLYALIGSMPYLQDRIGYTSAEYGIPALATMRIKGALVDQDLGVFHYVNPFPTDWRPVFSAEQQNLLLVSYPESNEPYPIEVGTMYATAGLPTGPIAPPMSAVKNPKVNGKDFFAPSTTDAETVTVSWDRPTGLAPSGYAVDIYVPVWDSWWGSYYTSDTSVTFPKEWFSTGISYVFTVTALADARAKVETAPRRSQLPIASASVVSAAVTINAPATPEASAMKVKPARKAVSATGHKAPHMRGFKNMQMPEPKPAK